MTCSPPSHGHSAVVQLGFRSGENPLKSHIRIYFLAFFPHGEQIGACQITSEIFLTPTQGDTLASLVIGSLLAILTVDVTGHVTRPTPSLAAMFVFSRPRIGVGGWDAGGVS